MTRILVICGDAFPFAPENTSFVLDNDTRMRGYRIQKTEDGLKLIYTGGTAIHIR